MAGFGRVNPTVAGTTPCFMESSTLIRPVTPAAASVCPTLDFTDPSRQNPVRFVLSRNARVSAATSIGSPTGVPVPCAST